MFSRAFSSGVQPVEIARKLSKEMDAHKTASVQRVYVPNEYTVWLCPDDYERFKDYESSLAQELSGHLLEHARHHDYDLLTRPVVNLTRTSACASGSSGSRPGWCGRRSARAPSRSRASTATRWSTRPPRPRRPAPSAARDAAFSETRAIVSLDDRRYVLDGPTATLGRSKEADCIIDDPNISRRHAELRRSQRRGLADRRPRARPTASRSTAAASRTPACLRATRSPSGPRLSPSTSSSERPRAACGRAQVRLSRRALPLPAVGDADARCGTCAARPRPATRPATTTSAGRRRRRTDAFLVVEEGGGLTRASASTSSAGSRSAARADADIRLDDRYASGFHARVFSRGGTYFVEDMNSTNGTLLNSARAPRRGRAHARVT